MRPPGTQLSCGRGSSRIQRRPLAPRFVALRPAASDLDLLCRIWQLKKISVSNRTGERARQLGASAFSYPKAFMRLPIIVAALSVLMFSTAATFLFVWLAWILRNESAEFPVRNHV